MKPNEVLSDAEIKRRAQENKYIEASKSEDERLARYRLVADARQAWASHT